MHIRRFMASRGHSSTGSSGFTLMELLVVIAVLLLIVLIAIPNLSGMKIQANENSAIASLRAIRQAELQYQSTYPTTGFTCSLAQLGAKPGAGTSTADHAHLLAQDLATGQKSGYTFQITQCAKGGPNDQFTSFAITAVPQKIGKTGHRGFCMDMQNSIKADPEGGTNCTDSTD